MRLCLLLLLLLFNISFASYTSIIKQSDSKDVLYSGMTVTFALALLHNSIDEKVQDEFRRSQPFKHHFKELGHFIGEVYPNLIFSAVSGAAGYGMDNEAMKTRFWYMVETTFYAGSLAYFLKFTTNQLRPDGSDRLTFPSGHSATAFAFAHVIWASFPEDRFYGSLAYGAAILTGLIRMNNDRHYLKDVVLGATLGIGYALALDPSKNKSLLTFQPILSREKSGLRILTRF